MKNRMIIFSSFIIIAILVLFLLVKREDEGANVKIGSVLILTGDFKSYGEQFLQGMKIAQKQINSTDTDSIDLVVYDSEGKKETALEKLKFLKERNGINFVSDIMGTGLAQNCLDYINNNNVLVLSGVNTGSLFTINHGQNFFRIIPSDGVAAQQLAKWAVNLKLKKAAVVYSGDDWGIGLGEVLKKSYKDLGGQIVIDNKIVQQQTMYQALITQLKNISPDVVFLLTYPREAGLILKEAHKQNFSVKFMGTDNFTGTELAAVAGRSIDSVMFVIPSSSKDTSQIFKAFLKVYKEEAGQSADPSLFNIMGYDCLNIIYNIYKESAGDIVKAREMLRNLDYKGVSGNISFDDNHDVKVGDYSQKIYIYNEKLKKPETIDY